MDKLIERVKELLEIEEKNDVFNMTREERAEFQQEVMAKMEYDLDAVVEQLEEKNFNVSCNECPHRAKCDEVQKSADNTRADLCGETMRVMAIDIVRSGGRE